jgi:hypothetical protein
MKKIRAARLLLITTFFRGITVTIVNGALNHVNMFLFLAQSFVLASGIMLPPAN